MCQMKHKHVMKLNQSAASSTWLRVESFNPQMIQFTFQFVSVGEKKKKEKAGGETNECEAEASLWDDQ